ncbi:MAG: prolyl oligopeptidase family serine peptidase [Bacteroidota bacterium]|nr:prolyl oligopeptidase family serine peptidase [Bacteroidota bacterium]MDP4258051.1 prolyl oligopeptidase family serine peptidase [Bacteroidota bacterium]
MKFQRILLNGIVLLGCSSARAQKPALDTSMIYRWPSVEERPILSSDGNYAGYVVADRNYPNRKVDYFLKGTYSSWEKQLPGVEKVEFTADGRRAIYQKGEALHMVTLGGDGDEAVSGVSSYQLFKIGSEEYLLYYSKTARRLTIRGDGKPDNYDEVDAWLLSADGRTLAKKVIHDKDHQTLSLINVQSKEEHIIWEGGPTAEWILDDSWGQMAFTTKDQNGKNHIWYYKTGQDKAVEIANNQSKGIDAGLSIGKLLNFSKDGSMLFFNLAKGLPKPDPNRVAVDIWSYRDAKWQSLQVKEAVEQREREYLTVIYPGHDLSVMKLQQDGERLSGKAEGRYVLFNKTHADDLMTEVNWSTASQLQSELVDTRTGKRSEIDGYYISGPSPAGRYMELADRKTGFLYTYELSTGVIRPLTVKVPISRTMMNDDGNTVNKPFEFFLGWFPNDRAVLVQDYYDLWELDPLGARTPINLTHFVGAKTKTTFFPGTGYPPGRLVVGDTMLLCAFNHQTKENGFYRLVLHSKQEPEKLVMGPYLYYAQLSLGGRPAVKATRSPVFLVSRESISESPNYFVTRDFKNFNPVSDVYPEKNYNWTRSKRFNFKTTDGRDDQGVLYLPEDFDPHKKYPLIFHYYERKSDLLNFYHNAANAGSGGGMSDLNIAWFTSHGYLVFTPDFHYALGRTGESILQTVEGAIKLLKTLAYVDTKHMGMQGHSFGGYETYYLVTHTHAFAAALGSAGPSDLVSVMCSMDYDPCNNPDFVEYDQERMGTTLWERPDNYIRNSPVFFADKVTTPLVIVANKGDGRVPFTQGLELFTALRRLGKTCWMLQYDKGRHGESGLEAIDCLLRSTQFFDHYLKGAPAPKWMVEGIPASRKQIDDGLELDPAGVEPGPGLLTPEARKAVDALKSKKPITITFN